VEIPWIGKVKGLLEAYLGGQAMAGAVADILFGDVNPSGKLAESFPEKLSHNPSFINFPGDREKVEYREGLFVGYRYYDKVDIKPLLPFGYGLSYTTFEYSDLQLDKQEMLDTDELTVTVRVKNTGNRAGKEIVQLYVSDVESSVLRPVKELKGFEKVDIGPGEEKTVTFKLGKRAFAYYNTELKDWHVESGDFEILIGKSSADIVLRKTVYVKSTVKLPKKYTMDSTLADIQNEPAAAPLFEKMSESLASLGGGGLGMDTQGMMSSISLRMLLMMGRGQVTLEMLNDLLAALNAD
jgi:beta-glucosidase